MHSHECLLVVTEVVCNACVDGCCRDLYPESYDMSAKMKSKLFQSISPVLQLAREGQCKSAAEVMTLVTRNIIASQSRHMHCYCISVHSMPACVFMITVHSMYALMYFGLHLFFLLSIWWLSGAMVSRVPTGQGKLEKVREFMWSGKGEGRICVSKY